MSNINECLLFDKDPILREKSQDLDINHITAKEQELINKMVEYIDICYENKYKKYNIQPGIAIACNQVGLLKKVIYVHFNENGIEHKYLIANPKIKSYSQQMCYLSSGEGCLSVPSNHEGYIPRHVRIIVEAYDLLNHKDIVIDASWMLSICLQHEIDHLSGILYYDHINKENPMFNKPAWIKI